MALTFAPATKRQARARVALIGPSGSGKTYTSLILAGVLCPAGGKVAVIDTERGSASKYAGLFRFDVLELDQFDPRTYVEAIQAAAQAGYQVLVVDSLSHAWTGKGGALELVDNAAKRSQSGSSYTAWRDVTPLHNRLVDAIIGAPMHVIATMRAKTDYVLDEVRRDGRTVKVPRKVGMAPVQRDGMEYEFDVVADMTLDLDLVVSKSRCPELTGAVINRPDEQVGKTLKAWLSDGQPEMSEAAGERADRGAKAGKGAVAPVGSRRDEPATTRAASDPLGLGPPGGSPTSLLPGEARLPDLGAATTTREQARAAALTTFDDYLATLAGKPTRSQARAYLARQDGFAELKGPGWERVLADRIIAGRDEPDRGEMTRLLEARFNKADAP